MMLTSRFCRLIGASTLALVALGAITRPGMAQTEAISVPSEDLSLSFTITGRVVEVLVREGEVVEAGQALVRLDDRAIVAQMALLKMRADSELEIKSREAEWKLAQNEEARIRKAFEQDAAGFFEVERAALTTNRALVRMKLAEEERAQAQAQYEQALLAHTEATMLAPIAGIIETITIDPGEMVQQAKPVVRLVVIDPLRIDVPAPTMQTLGMEVGQEVSVSMALPSWELPVPARIISIASVADPASETRIVRLLMDNPEGKIPAGTPCVVTFGAVATAQGRD